MNDNILLCTDVYKMGHMEQYPKGTTKIYSYLQARKGDKLPNTLFFGLQYYLKMLEQPITWQMAEEFLQYREMILGMKSDEVARKMYGLANLGFWPLKIKAVPEGSIIPTKNVLMTMTNTHPDFHWTVGFLESLLLKVWNTCTVASYSKKLKDLCKKFADETCDNGGHLPFQVHDFGYRGCSSEETAALSGASHLVNFLGTDTVPAVKFVRDYYGGSAGPVGLSVPASEHSVMCAFTRERELDAFQNMLDLYPSGIVSIVSDTYDLWNVLTNFTDKLKDQILAREGKIVFRPDSGDPEQIICGNNDAEDETHPEFLGALQLLWEKFGGIVNSKGYKVLNPKVGLIYGDGMYYERFERILERMKKMGFASSNLVIGVGGLLLQQHNRDEQGYAIKATYAEINGKSVNIMKDPITDHSKKSHQGRLSLQKMGDSYITFDGCTEFEESFGLLKTVFKDGQIMNTVTFDEIRKRANES